MNKCSCGERNVNECDEEWGPDCDLGNNEKYVKVLQVNLPAPVAQPLTKPHIEHEYLIQCKAAGVEPRLATFDAFIAGVRFAENITGEAAGQEVDNEKPTKWERNGYF